MKGVEELTIMLDSRSIPFELVDGVWFCKNQMIIGNGVLRMNSVNCLYLGQYGTLEDVVLINTKENGVSGTFLLYTYSGIPNLDPLRDRRTDTYNKVRGLIKSYTPRIKYCFYCGGELKELRLGCLKCTECNSQFIPHFDEDKNQSLTHICKQ